MIARVDELEGHRRALITAGTFILTELVKVPKFAVLVLGRRLRHEQDERIVWYSASFADALMAVGGEVEPFTIDIDTYRRHVALARYPANYAGGSADAGGQREQKQLEYFLSIEMLQIEASDVVVDIASEWSVFPAMLRELVGATVYRQDLRYLPGVNGDRIGGTAANLPLPSEFADKLVLHNAFQHFEGSADSSFIEEAWRVLRPGGKLCILPLFITDRHSILTDPLVSRKHVKWDEGARIITRPWWHNRFGRIYDARSVKERVLRPGRMFASTIYHVVDTKQVHPAVQLHFALVMYKPLEASSATVSHGKAAPAIERLTS